MSPSRTFDSDRVLEVRIALEQVIQTAAVTATYIYIYTFISQQRRKKELNVPKNEKRSH